ncbi:MAG: 1,4-dihydroxy-2-naphthoate polyprenyltransferase [Acidobacteriota bacterium]|nr:1,4-dihydroxy-2-naphthoate polyprenyltransferase [Acidobacteriota bacterium]MDE3264864.1 1,4-dihydroxy-2-naphthoate polyprenyltransferase [Acidobacteriota bacterium]
MSPGGRRPGNLGAWAQAIRPKTLWAALTPVVVGSACAMSVSGFRFGPALAALGVGVFIQIGTNLSNDVLDFDRGADTERRVGPARAVQSGLLSRGQVWLGASIAFGLCMVCGLYLAAVAGWPVLVLGAVSIASGLLYTAGPWALAYLGLGDLFVFLFFGLAAVVGTTYVQALEAPAVAWWAGIAVGALATAILVVNNLRDRETDAAAGKRTLAVRFGARFTRLEYAALLLVGHAAALPLAVRFGPWPMLSWLSLPFAVALLRSVWRSEGAALNAALAATARLLLLFGVLLSIGIVLGARN